MKILLTGKPRSGKTTLLQSLVEKAPSKYGLMAIEVRKDSDRIGFDLQDNLGRIAPLARTEKPTNFPVGRYFADVASLDAFIEPLFGYEPEQLLYVDEIGHMQLFSEKFQKLVKHYLNSGNDFIGTISCVYEHPFIDEVRRRDDILLCTVTPENRDELHAALSAALAHREQLRRLSEVKQQIVLELTRQYLESDKLISLRKLFNNAILYVVEHRIEKVSDTEYRVRGNHEDHIVATNGSANSCDCDLFNGRGRFKDKTSECSHIQAVKISQV